MPPQMMKPKHGEVKMSASLEVTNFNANSRAISFYADSDTAQLMSQYGEVSNLDRWNHVVYVSSYQDFSSVLSALENYGR